MILFDPGCLLVWLGIQLWRNAKYSKELAFTYNFLIMTLLVFLYMIGVDFPTPPFYFKIQYGIDILPGINYSVQENDILLNYFWGYAFLKFILSIITIVPIRAKSDDYGVQANLDT